MKTYMTRPLSDLVSEITNAGSIKADDVKKISEKLFADGIIDREKANFLFTVNDTVSGSDNDPSWPELFVKALTAHVLEDEVSPDVLDEDEANYLIEKIQSDGVVDATELSLLVNICANAKDTPEFFQEFTLSSMKDAILEDGIIDENEVEMIRKVIYGSGSGAGAGVDRREADFIFDLNDATSGKENHPAWKELFIEAISKHVLEDEVSPGEIDDNEARWLIERIEGDEQYDENEKALLANIKEKAKSISEELEEKMAILNI